MCCRSHHNNTDGVVDDELTRRRKTLDIREKELIKTDIKLQRKIKEFKKRSDGRAKADLAAAEKLRNARRKLLVVLDSKHKPQKCNDHKCKENKLKNAFSRLRSSINKEKNKRKQDFTDILFESCEKVLNPSREISNMFMPFLRRNVPLQFSEYPRSQHTSYDNESARDTHLARRNYHSSAGDCYLMSLGRTPQVWIYHRWPHFYPHYLNARMQWKHLGYIMLFLAGFLFWVPMLLCLELCKCFFCACCCDC